jgi:hypothetical protein
MTWGTTVLSLYLYFPHQSLWHGVQRLYHCTCIFHINLYNMGYNCSNLYDMGYNGSNLYHMGYNSSIIVLSTSIFMTWGKSSNLYDMGFNGSNLYDMGYNCSIIELVFSTPHDNLIVYKCFKRFIVHSMEVKSIEIFSGMSLTNCIK